MCVNDLGQVGLAFHTFSNDHNGKYPMAISTNDGGSLEYVEGGFAAGSEFYTAFRNFQPLSNALVHPEMLICPTDWRMATNFEALQNCNLSYFVGVEATFDKPGSHSGRRPKFSYQWIWMVGVHRAIPGTLPGLVVDNASGQGQRRVCRRPR